MALKRKVELHSLGRILRNPVLVKPLIYQRCVSISQMATKSFHLLDILMMRDVDGWPDFSKLDTFIQLFTVGCSNDPIAPVIAQAWRDHFEPIGYPPAERSLFDDSLISYNAKLYQTAFLHNLRRRFAYRQRKAIRAYLGDNAQKKEENDIARALRRKGQYDVPTKHYNFIENHKRHLPSTDGKFSAIDYLKYYKFLSQEYPSVTALKTWRLFPQRLTRRRFIAINCLGMNGLLKHAKTIDESVKGLWLKNAIEKNGWTFDKHILTDGEHCYAYSIGNNVTPLNDTRASNTNKKLKMSKIETKLHKICDGGKIGEYLYFYVKNFDVLWSKNSYKMYGAGQFQSMYPSVKIFQRAKKEYTIFMK